MGAYQAASWSLPIEPLEGELCSQFIRCGKSGCRCQSGHLHGPYFYRIWRSGARVNKVYVKSSELEAVKAGCEAHREMARSLREIKQTRMRLTHSLQKEWRHTQRLLDK